MRIFALFIFLAFTCSCNQYQKAESDWQIVFKNDADGNTILGDKSKLIDAVRLGYPIRIGFGGRGRTDTTRSVEHVADAQFLTIANGNEVFAQIEDIYGQRPTLDSDTLQIALRHENKWTLIIGTNGERSTLSRFFDHEKTAGSRSSQRGVTWYVKMPNERWESKPQPLW